MSLGLVAVCVIGMGLAAPAMAHNFTASRAPHPLSEAEPGKTKGIGIEGEKSVGEKTQELKFGVFRIFCAAKTHANTQAEGAVTWSTSSTFATEVNFSKCQTEAKYGNFKALTNTKFNVNPETKKSEPIKVVYHVNGFAEIGTGETVSEVELGSGAASWTIAGKVCHINWPAQTVPAKAEKLPEAEYSSAVYSNNFVPLEKFNVKQFPTGEQERLVIANAFKGMKWEYEEGQCVGEGGFEEEAKSTEQKSGMWNGNLEITLNGGNIGFE